MIKNFKWLLIASISFVACTNNNNEVVVVPNTSDGLPLTAGTANFSKYVALGDSFAAGFSDSALFKTGQDGAYTNVMAQQFALVGGGAFAIPYMKDDLGGFSNGGNQIPQFATRLYFNGAGPVNTPGISGTSISEHLTGAFNNMGVPGAKSFHLTFSGYAAANPYFGRFATSATATVLGDALAQTPTFFSLWIGGNDVLGYALNGGVPTSQDAVNGNDITPPATFDAVYNGMITQLIAGGRKGVIANLTYVNTLPHFTTVPFNPLSAKVLGGGDEAVGTATINALNAQLYGPLKGALTALGQGGRINLLSSTASNPLLIKDETLTDLTPQLNAIFQGAPFNMPAPQAGLFAATFGKARQATATDLILLSTQGAIAAAPTATDSGLGIAPPAPLNKFGITFPLQDKHVLIPSEVAEIKVATDAYNVTIKNAATTNSLALADTKTMMEQLSSPIGISANNFTLTSTYVTGGAFSLDGVHPSPRGYALIANKFLEAINAKYTSNFKGVDLGNYRILYPKTL